MVISRIFILASICSIIPACSQKPQSFEEMCARYVKGSVALLHRDTITNNLSDYLILDARELKEYEVSHLPQAVYFGSVKPDMELLKDKDTNTAILVYCSIGYRSELIGEKIKSYGFQNVYNLSEGIFGWANNSLQLVNAQGKTTMVHGYNKRWGKWLNASVCTPILE